LLKREADKSLGDIIAVAQEIESREADFVVSTIVIAEMLDVIDDSGLAAAFNGFLQRPNVVVFNVDAQVARLTAELRAEWRRTSTAEHRNIKTPDAIVLATAILGGADVLHTFEPKLLRFSGTPLVSNLAITSPALFTAGNTSSGST
jgi:predicted nucleic acid-binding protein